MSQLISVSQVRHYFSVRQSEYKRNTKRAPGEVVIYVKHSLAFGSSDLMLHKDSDDILWLRIEGAKLNLDGDLFICLCYNLPSDSSRQSLIGEDMFDRVCNYVTFVVGLIRTKIGILKHLAFMVTLF